MAPSSGPWRPDGFVRGVARFAVPTGVLVGTGLVAGYLFAMCAVMTALYVAALLMPETRSCFALTIPGAEMIVTALAASAVSIGALALSGYSSRVAPADLE